MKFKQERRRRTRYGKPDHRFTNSHGDSNVQKITGKESLWRLYVRPGVSTSTTYGRPNPYWLKASEPGAIVYDVWAHGKKNARLLVKLSEDGVGVRAKGPHMPGIRRRHKVPTAKGRKVKA